MVSLRVCGFVSVTVIVSLFCSRVGLTVAGQERTDVANDGRVAIANADLERLKESARKASRFAYCPYSRFPVGAAVLTDSGKIFSGCNVENASYGLTICAERNAVFQAIADGKTSIVAVVIYTPTASPTAPCGACRQVINEFGPKAMVVCICDGKHVLNSWLDDLLPDAFGPHNLGKPSGGRSE